MNLDRASSLNAFFEILLDFWPIVGESKDRFDWKGVLGTDLFGRIYWRMKILENTYIKVNFSIFL